MIEVRRDEDDELCGYVAEQADGWRALTVFGADLGLAGSFDGAAAIVLGEGLASLAEHWILNGPGVDADQIACIQSASPGEVSLALDYYSMPGVPTLTLSAAELRSGTWSLRRAG